LLTYFTVTEEVGRVLISWQTTTEINSSHFIVEKSLDGLMFQQVSKLNAKGNSTFINIYQSQDLFTGIGRVYYRLKTVDKDGKFQYSAIVMIDKKAKTAVAIFPNPVDATLQLRLVNDKAGNLRIRILDLNGKIERSQMQFVTKGTSMIFVNVSSLSRGVHILEMSGSSSGNERFFKL
jgi:hypothetical protein